MKAAQRLFIWAVLIGGFSATGCIYPKYVTGVTSREGTVKFLYHSAGSSTGGVIECKSAANGDLSQCIDRNIVFKD